MRTTVRLDPDVAAAVQKLRRDSGISLSEAVDELARAGSDLSGERADPHFRQRAASIGIRMELSCVGDAVELLESEESEGGPYLPLTDHP